MATRSEAADAIPSGRNAGNPKNWVFESRAGAAQREWRQEDCFAEWTPARKTRRFEVNQDRHGAPRRRRRGGGDFGGNCDATSARSYGLELPPRWGSAPPTKDPFAVSQVLLPLIAFALADAGETRSGSRWRLLIFQMRERTLGLGPHRPQPLDRPIDRRTSHTEQLGQLGDAVGAKVMQLQQVLGLVRLQLRLLAAQPTLRLRHLHALPGAQPDQIRLDYVDNSVLSSRMTGRTEPFPTVEVWPVAVRVHRTMVCARNAADPHGRSAHAICGRWVRTRTVGVQRSRCRRSPGRSARSGRSRRCTPILRRARWRRGRRVRIRRSAGCRAPWPWDS